MRRELFVITVSSVCKCLRMLEEFALRALNAALHISSTVLVKAVSPPVAVRNDLNSRVTQSFLPGREAVQLLTLQRAPFQGF